MARKKPYTERGLKQVSCARCDDPASSQVRFSVDNLWTPICAKCEADLNILYLVFMGDPKIDAKIQCYRSN